MKQYALLFTAVLLACPQESPKPDTPAAVATSTQSAPVQLNQVERAALDQTDSSFKELGKNKLTAHREALAEAARGVAEIASLKTKEQLAALKKSITHFAEASRAWTEFLLGREQYYRDGLQKAGLSGESLERTMAEAKRSFGDVKSAEESSKRARAYEDTSVKLWLELVDLFEKNLGKVKDENGTLVFEDVAAEREYVRIMKAARENAELMKIR